jgi:starch synthase (maltosyl-transferring)
MSRSTGPVTPHAGRFPIQHVEPVVSCGRYPAKAIPGEALPVYATVIREGHDAVGVSAVLFAPDGSVAQRVRMHPQRVGGDRYAAELTPTAEGAWSFAVESWDDPVETWHHNADIKIDAGIDVELMCEEGARLFELAADPSRPQDLRTHLLEAARTLRDASRPAKARFNAVADVVERLHAEPLRRFVSATERFPVFVDRERALVGSWYEFFPRSEGAVVKPGKKPVSGSFKTATQRLSAVKAMGFDVVYLPPIHPIGRTFRKGKNNTLTPDEHDVGVPWAIGAAEGGHDAVHPDLGTIKDFDRFVKEANSLGLEIALDLALQASPDHPWVKEHSEWFTTRADGTIAYAENPPKKYQDIYPLNFDNDYEGLYNEIARIVRFWMSHGVRIFRVDNPHTKPVHFWEELLADIRTTDPDVIFLAEAFTKPTMMHLLGKVGFHQSYTYFTWRTGKHELEEYGRELAEQTSPFFRPNFFVNTPDILHAFLQSGNPAAFAIRAVLASTLSPTWGVYAGFELFEHVPLRPGSEEYLDSEKYQLRPRDWKAAAASGKTLIPLITELNRIRREHPALQRLRNLRFHGADSDQVIVYSKREGEDTVIVIVNLNPDSAQESWVHFDMSALGLPSWTSFAVEDLLSGERYTWGEHAWVRLAPEERVAHIVRIVKA